MSANPSSIPASETVSAKDLYSLIREQMQHEDDLVNQRINWLLALQGFMFVAFAQVLTSTNNGPHKETLFVMAGIGSCICVLALASISGARRAIRELDKFWTKRLPVIEPKTDTFPIISYKGVLDRAEIAAYGIPAVLILAWILLLFSI